MKRLFPLIFSLICAFSSSSQQLNYIDLLRDRETYAPLASIIEPLPWGLEPLTDDRYDLLGQVATYSQSHESFSQQYDENMPKDAWAYSCKAGALDSDWIVNDGAVSWTENDVRFVWDRYASTPMLTEWKGKWSSPDYIKRYKEGSGSPFETLEKSGAFPNRWVLKDSDDNETTWVRTVSGSAVKWTAYDKDGTGIKRLISEKDAKGIVMKAEYWSSINTREWDISLKKLETGATLKASTGDSESVVATFSKGLNPKNLQLKMNNDIFLYEFLIDQDNRVIETRQTKNGTPTWRLIFTREQLA